MRSKPSWWRETTKAEQDVRVVPGIRSVALRDHVGETCISGRSAEGQTNDQERRFNERAGFGPCVRRVGALEAHCRRAKFMGAVSRWSPRLLRVEEYRKTSKAHPATGEGHGGRGKYQKSRYDASRDGKSTSSDADGTTWPRRTGSSMSAIASFARRNF